jgi:hypothetical protein
MHTLQEHPHIKKTPIHIQNNIHTVNTSTHIRTPYTHYRNIHTLQKHLHLTKASTLYKNIHTLQKHLHLTKASTPYKNIHTYLHIRCKRKFPSSHVSLLLSLCRSGHTRPHPAHVSLLTGSSVACS